jgi:hypothetical protein
MAPLRVLAVAEKPSVAKELAEILSNKSYRTNQGASRFNRLFEFTVPYGGGQCQMTMTSVSRLSIHTSAHARMNLCSLPCCTSYALASRADVFRPIALASRAAGDWPPDGA